MSSGAGTGSVVLVHGAWADGSCWSNVIVALRRQGFEVTAAPLPLTSLSDDAAAVRRAVERARGPVTLVGHAYGGAAMGAVRDERVKSLVYIAALAPQEGETVAELFYRTPPHAEAPQLQPDPQGWLWMPEQGFVHAVAHRASADQAAIMHAVQRPIAVACIQQRAPAPAWQGMPCWYLLAEQDRMISPDNQRFMANRMGATIRSLDVDHTPMYTAPDVVVELIRTAAREA